MLKQLFHVFVFSFLFYSSAFGQCKSILTDTLCPLQNYTYVGNKDFKSIDFCPNRLDSLVFINSLPTYAARQIKVLKTKGKYYLINPDYGTSVMRNYEFNSDFTVLLNANYTVLPTNDTCYYSTAYEMAPVDTVRWVGFKADVAFNHLYKIAFDSITDPTPEFTYIGDFNLSAAYMMRIYGKYLFLTNSGTNSITRILFNDDFSAVLNSDIIVGDFYTPIGIDIVFDCSTGNYFGFVANNATGTLSRIDFGTSLATANPTVMALSTNVGFARGLKVYNQENVWYTITNTFPENKLKVWQIGAITDTVFTAVFDTSTSPIGWDVEILVDSSRLHIFSSLQPTHYQFQGCLLNNTWFENTDSVNLSYYLSDTGYNYVELTHIDSLGTTSISYDSVFVTVTPPEANFFTSSACEGQPISFYDSSAICYGNIIGWLWDFGDSIISTLQNPVHQYASGGTYNVTLTVYANNADSGVTARQVALVPLPVANFTITTPQVCAFSNVVFTDQSTAPNDSIVSWLWTFGDGNSSPSQNPQYSYLIAGNLQLQLTVTNSKGCVDSAGQAMQVIETPLAGFSVTQTCLNSTVLFQNLTDSFGAPVIAYSWFFGDGASSLLPNPAHIYAGVDSVYDVQLIAKSSNGCSTSFRDSIIIAAPAMVSFAVSNDSVCQNEPVVFTNATTTNNQLVLNKFWYFSDGFIAQNSDTVIHSFNQSGTYLASLVITTATSCDTTYSKTIVVLENPAANFVFTNVCLYDSNLFVDTSTPVAGDNITNYVWHFGDSTSINNVTSAYHQYSNAGQYAVSVNIVTNKGCTDSLTQQVSVYELPIANFIPAQVLCSDSANQFLDFSFVNSNDTINKWWWDFGDANTATIMNPTNYYLNSGGYTVRLIVETQKGCRDTLTKPILVKQSPGPSFSFDSTCFGNLTAFNFINLSPNTGLINAWNWNFGEFGTANSTLQNPAHIYAQYGLYTVTVTATDTNQCKADFAQSIKINDLPKPGFVTTNACEEVTVLFTDTSTVNGSVITQWSWFINGVEVSVLNTSDYVFNQTGTYPVQLQVTSAEGCTNSILKPVVINTLPQAVFATNPPYATPGQIVSFSNTSSDAINYNWNFGDGSTSNLIAPTHIYTDTNNYLVTLIAYSDKGCSDTATRSYSVLIPVVEIAIIDAGYSIKNSLMSITAQVVNLGNVDITAFDLSARFNETPVLIESPAQSITVSNPNLLYTFKSRIVINDSFDPAFFCVEASRPNGVLDISTNNTKCKSIDNTLQLLNVAPNPVVDVMQLYVNSPGKQDLKLSVYDVQGRQMINTMITVKKGFSIVNVDVSSLSNGLYVLHLNDGTYNLNSVFEKQ